ncbi:hypothetical protein AX760_13620 [Pararhizobium antarcticum]|uniref:DUF6538 domain-containing protein n=2 Tax=Pararhizobium antarcticum TaxID=1798805 RepID=A0A657LWS1_9HYPH|nr:hypothetical protein AX761_23155 [Rhizobium sp. 58]OJF99246.1 hypothetical protein AX760_13620 [Pararhizobium antarcticum]
MSNQYRLHLHPNGYYYHRAKVPADIRHLYGKEIEQRSLRTRDYWDAVRRLSAVIVEVNDAFARFRTEHAGELAAFDRAIPCCATEQPVRIDVKRHAADFAKSIDAEEFVRRTAAFEHAAQNPRAFLDNLNLAACCQAPIHSLDDCEQDTLSVLREEHRLHIEVRIAAVTSARAAGDFRRWTAAVDERVPKIDMTQRAALVRAMIEAELKALAAWQDEPELMRHPSPLARTDRRVAAAVLVDAAEHSPRPLSGLPLMSVISEECFMTVGKEKNWSAKTDAARHNQIRQFLDICGDKSLSHYTQDDIRYLKATLFALPPQSHGKKEFKGLSKHQIAEKARERKIPGLSAESVRQVMTAANIVFGWARAEYDHTLLNIVQPMIPTPSSSGSKRGRREAFSVEELQRLFESPVFTGVESVGAWLKAGNVRMSDTGRFWVPLMALYSGARLMEAVQLLRRDVDCEDGIWFIDINDGPGAEAGKSVKNEASVRRVPVHPELVRLGFLDFVQTVEKDARLFPDIAIGSAAQRHRYASKLFSKLLVSADVKGPKKVWHSLRHSFEQACRDSGVDSAIMDQLQGHIQKGMRGVYGDGYKLPALYDGIKAIRYDGLNLSHIHPSEPEHGGRGIGATGRD